MLEILFLGTAGARYVVAKQFRASGGLLLKRDRDYLLIDPGPGSLVYLAKYKISPDKISFLLVSHKHLDHSADINVLVDAITEGGFKKRGRVFLPEEVLQEGLLLSYLRNALREVIILSEKETYQVGSWVFHTTKRLLHSAENYGFIFELDQGKRLGLITDTAYFEGLAEEFKEISHLIVNVVRYQPKEGVLHLSISDVKLLLKKIRPELTILTHFGMTMLKANPFKVARELSAELNLQVISAYDGMRVNL
jgi:ribonuclease BN (tRNA processing enzyme)